MPFGYLRRCGVGMLQEGQVLCCCPAINNFEIIFSGRKSKNKTSVFSVSLWLIMSSGNNAWLATPGAFCDPGDLLGDGLQRGHDPGSLLTMFCRIGFVALQIDP